MLFLTLSPVDCLRPRIRESAALTCVRRPKPSLTIDEHDHVLGRPSSPVLLVQYGDYTCPHSAEAHKALAEVAQSWPHRVALAYRHFPSPQRGPLAGLAAEAAEFAAARGLFWPMHERLMADRGVSDAQFFTWHAAAVGLDVKEFSIAMEQRTHAAVVESHLEDARRHGVRHSPAIFINGVAHEGATDRKSLVRAIEQTESGNR